MRTALVISCLLAVSGAQLQHSGSSLREAGHLQAINQPHLPKDPNVLHATQQFLSKFAELKALADAAPDTPQSPQSQRQRFAAPQPAPAHSLPPTQHRFAAQQPAHQPASAPHPANNEFDVTREIGALLARHHAANPTPAPAPRRIPPPPPQQPQQVHHQQAPLQQFPSFNVHNNLGNHQQQTFAEHQAPAPRRVVDPNIPITNQHGHVINPQQFPGPLAHSIPAGVSGRVENTQFTPEVAQAHRELASAHANILNQQAALARPGRFQ